MKTKLNRFGKSSLSIVLAVMMLFSSMLVASNETIDTTAKAIEAAVNDVAENETDAADSAENDSAAENTEPAQQPEQTVKAAKSAKTTPKASGDGTYTFYFDNTIKWARVGIHYWGDGLTAPSFRSTDNLMYYDTDLGLYYKTFSVCPQGIIFLDCANTGDKNQTVNVTNNIADGAVFAATATGNQKATCSKVGTDPTAYSTAKGYDSYNLVWYHNSTGSNNSDLVSDGTNISKYMYAYGNDDTLGAWRGLPMAYVGNIVENYWALRIPTTTTGLIFNNEKYQRPKDGKGYYTVNDDHIYEYTGDLGVTYTGWQTFLQQNDTNKVYFKKPSGWGTPKCYAWYGPTNNTWPGVIMTLVSGETDIYECTLEKPYKNVIFVDSSNDSNKTTDQTLSYTESTNNLSLHYYDYDNDQWLATYPSTAQATYVEQSYTVYFDNKENPYDEVYAYPYANDNASLDTQTKIANWPGVEMTYDSSTKLYSATFTMKHRENIDTPKIMFSNHGIFPNELRDATDTIPSAKLQTKSYTLVSNNVYTALLAENNSGTTKTAYGTPSDVSDVYVSGRFQKKVGDTVTTTYKSGSSSGWTTSALPEFKFTETATSGVFKFETGLSVAELTAQYTPSGSTNSYDKEFFIIYNDNKGSHRYQISGDSNRVLTMTDEQTAIAMTPYSNRHYKDDEGHQKSLIIHKNLIFNDNYSSGTVNLFYDINSNVFWFEVTGNNHYTLTAASANASNFDFTTKSVSGGSTQKVRILNTPPKQVVDAVTLTYNNGETLTAIPEGNGYYSFAMPAYDATISVTFRNRKTFTVSTAVNNADLGSVVVSASTVKEGDSVTLKANPAYVAQNEAGANNFTEWHLTSGTGSYVSDYSSTDELIEFVPTSDVTLTANFTHSDSASTVNYYVLYSYTTDNPDNWKNNNNDRTIAKIKKDSHDNKYFEVDLTSYKQVWFNILNNDSFSLGNIVNNTNSITDETGSVYSDSLNKMTKSEINHDNGHVYPIKLERKEAFKGAVRVYITDGADKATTFKAVPRVSTLTSSTTGGVTVYAKDGTIREEYQKYDQLADTSITKVVDIEGNTITNQRTKKTHTYYDEWTGIEAGDVITIKTQLNSGYFNKYYVKAFCINGVSHSLYGENEEPGVTDTERTTGTYTMDYKVPDGVKYLEITPIYFYLEKGGDYSYLGFIKFRVENFTGEIVNEWGNTISCQVWYTNGSEKAAGNADNKNALGGYPGQPLISSGTYYYTQVPKAIPKNYEGVDINANTEEKVTVQGMTLNNYYWDSIHQDLSGKDSSFKGVNNTRSDSAINSQSYDYNDFAALAKMGANDIIFTMKYETKTANKDTTSTNVNTYQNRFHGFVDYFDRGIDLFGHILHSEGETNFKNLENTSFKMTYADYNDSKTYSESDIEGTTVFTDNQKLWIVSRGYQAIRNNVSGYYGNYATVWDIYTRSGETLTKVGSLPGSCLIPNATGYKTDSNGDLPTSGNDYNSNKALFLSFCSTETARSAAADKYFSDFVTLYNSYRGVPAMITYEKAIAEAGVQNDMGLRSDGRWYYSAATGTYPLNPNPAVKADLRIQFRDLKDGSTTEYDQAFTTEVLTLTDGKAIGGSTGAKVWFTAPSTGAALIKNAADNQDDNNTRLQVSADYSDTESFEFKADSLVVKNNKVYVFRGWQVELANVTPLNSDDETNTTGSANRNANNSFIARYEEIAATDSVIVSHEILKNNTTDANAKSGGNGAVYVSVEVQTSTGGHVYTYPTTDGTIPIDPVYLTLELGYKFKITLSNEPEETSHFVDSYESDGTTSLNNQTFTLTRTEIINKKDVNTNIVKYLTDFAKNILNLHFNYYDRPDDGVHEYEDVTTPRTVNISVNYKNGQTTENIIMETMTGNAEVADGGSAVSVSSIRNIMDDYKFWTTQEKAKAGIKALDNLHNSGNTYGETTDALTQYHTDNHGNPVFQSGDNYYYGSVEEKNKITEFNTITNRWVSYKLQSDEMLSDNDQTDPSQVKDIYLWAFNYPREYTVRYHYPQILTKPVTDENGEEVKDNEGNTLTEPDLAVLVDAATATIDASTKLPSNVYFVSPTDTKNPIASVKSYYQQRVGAATDLTELRKAYLTPAKKAELKSEAYNELSATQKAEYDAIETDEAKEEYMASHYEAKYVTYLTQKSAEIDAVGGHIGNYGVTQGYAGATYYDTKEEINKLVGGNGEIRAATNALYDTGTKDEDDNIIYGDLVFDGWYDAATGKKVSSSELFGYRINVGMDLYAGYVVAENKNTDIGVTVTQLDDDDFIVDVAEGTYKNRTRYNTQLNVYNSPDNNTNITDTVVVYVQLPITAEHTTSWWKQQFVTYPDVTNNLRENIQGHLNNDNKITNGKYKAFGEEITWNSTTVAVKESGFAYPTSTLGLNNKNSVHYTINFDLDSVKESKANSAILVFAGIKINDNWIVSENAADHINAEVPSSGED